MPVKNLSVTLSPTVILASDASSSGSLQKS